MIKFFLFILLSNLYVGSIYSQDSNQFSISLVEQHQRDDGQYKSTFKFKVPATSDEVLDCDLINCKGWMPRGASIKEIKITSIAGLPTNARWECAEKDSTWQGGQDGSLKVITIREPVFKNRPITIYISGLGSLYGIRKWYDCSLQLKI